MKEDFHIDMSGRLYEKGTVGIACVGSNTKNHNGCALKGKMRRYIEKNLYIGSVYKENAKIYAIAIYFLIRNNLENIDNLIICNDENFLYVREYLYFLLDDFPYLINIINITEFQKKLGRKVKSLADNYAKAYKKRGLKRNKWHVGIPLNVVVITFEMIKNKWNLLKKI
ncbi:hypothetical protein ES705_16921 [subsurface metagenome]